MSGSWDAVVVGAGAAGLMAAAAAGKRGKRVLLLERSPRPGAKILVSGGGRCNFTNLGAEAGHYLSQNPHFAKSALARYKPSDFLALVQKYGIPYHEKKLGQLFCDRGAKDILAMLLAECKEAGVELRCGVAVGKVSKTAAGFIIEAGGELMETQALIVATGGLSFPKLGATDFGYRLAAQFGVPLVPTAPALDGFTFGGKELADFEGLAGVAAEAVLSCGGKSFSESLLFTHLGLSGPAALQASLYWKPGLELQVNFGPHPPRRLAQRLKKLKLDQGPWRFVPSGTVGYAKAEVTRGGVDTAALDSKTMQCRDVKGLYFIGEVVDVTGELGGYNFQWAWASAQAAAAAL